MNLEDALRFSRDLKIFGHVLEESAKIMDDATLAIKLIKRLAGSPKSGDLSTKLITAGMACVVFPEPFISDIFGSTLIATGMLLRSRRGPTMVDIFREIKRIMTDLERISVKL